MSYLQGKASPDPIYAKVVNASTGAAITSGVAAYHVHGTTRTAGAGSLSHVANGLWAYTPTQGETNYWSFAVEFYHASAVGSGPAVMVSTCSKLVSQLNDLAGAGIRTAVGMAAADLDTQISSLETEIWVVGADLTDCIADVQGVPGALLDKINGIETGCTLKQAVQRIAAICAGKISGAKTGTETFKGLDGTTDRVRATVDDDGNRTAMEYDP